MVQLNQQNNTDDQDNLFDLEPLADVGNAENTDLVPEEAASEVGEIQPVLGSNSPPQQIFDLHLLGGNDINGDSAADVLDGAFDPENDTRMHEKPDET